MKIFLSDRVSLPLPEGHRFPADLLLRFAISFGYPLDPAQIEQQPRKGGRRSLDEIAHWERW